MKLALGQQAANEALDLAPKSRWLTSPQCPIPRSDIRPAGGRQPLWRWRVADLEAFLAERSVAPGHVGLTD